MWPELASAWEPAKAENPMHKELLKSAIHRELRKKTTANKGSPKRHETRFTDRLSSLPSRKKVSPRTVNRAPAVENSFDISDLVSPGNLAAFLQDTSSSEEDDFPTRFTCACVVESCDVVADAYDSSDEEVISNNTL